MPVRTGFPEPGTVVRARRLLEQGHGHYGRGEYELAERAYSQSIAVYPFLPECNLGLAKIFLIRAAATRDETLLHNAKLMLEMARALDPELREAALLLELFSAQPID